MLTPRRRRGFAFIALATLNLLNARGQGTLGRGAYQDPNCFAMSAEVEDGHALGSDGKGPYIEGQNEARVQARGAMAIWAWRYTESMGNKPDPAASAPKLRSLRFDLDHPVEGGGGQRLGVLSDQIGRFHAFWKREESKVINFTLTPLRQTVNSERIEMWVYGGGHQYVLQMGPWAMGLFTPRTGVPVQGTSQATIRRESEKEWVISAPPGSVARLSNYDDIKAPLDMGLYYFDFTVRARKLESAACLDLR